MFHEIPHGYASCKMLMSTRKHSSVGDGEVDGCAEAGMPEGVWLGAAVEVGAAEYDGELLGCGVTSRQWKNPAPLKSDKKWTEWARQWSLLPKDHNVGEHDKYLILWLDTWIDSLKVHQRYLHTVGTVFELNIWIEHVIKFSFSFQRNQRQWAYLKMLCHLW